MKPIHVLSAAEQVAECLRAELLGGRMGDRMPGVPSLAKELAVSQKTVKSALGILENDGLLESQGQGLPRQIVLREPPLARALRVAILPYENSDRQLDYFVDLRYGLSEAGHHAFFTEKTLTEIGMELPRIRRLVAANKVDAWVIAGGSREVLEWFSAQPVPAFGLFGRMEGMAMAGTKPDRISAITACVSHLADLGHRRIVMLSHRERRLPEPGHHEQFFLEQLESYGIPTGPYNLPDWEDSPEGFQRGLDSLFDLTPPTALIAGVASLFYPTLQFLGNRGLQVPEEVSLVCGDADPGFDWCRPTIAHMSWNPDPMVDRIVRWANNVARGKDDCRQIFIQAEFVEGGTLGPAPRVRDPAKAPKKKK